MADDEKNSQFQEKRTKKPLSEGLVFADWKKRSEQLQKVYKNQFKSLVFNELPDEEAINKSMNIITRAIHKTA